MADKPAEVTTLGSVAGLLAGTLRGCGIDLARAADPDTRVETRRMLDVKSWGLTPLFPSPGVNRGQIQVTANIPENWDLTPLLVTP